MALAASQKNAWPHNRPKRSGYDVVTPRPQDDQSGLGNVVQRSVGGYTMGKGSLPIVRDLERQGAQGLARSHWNALTLLGSPKRCSGILDKSLRRPDRLQPPPLPRAPDTCEHILRENTEKESHRQCALAPHRSVAKCGPRAWSGSRYSEQRSGASGQVPIVVRRKERRDQTQSTADL